MTHATSCDLLVRNGVCTCRDPRTGEDLARRRARQKKRVTAWRAANTELRRRHAAEFFELFEAEKGANCG